MVWRQNPAFGPGTKIDQLQTVTADFTIGTEAANVINVAIQLNQGAVGDDVSRAMSMSWYLSSDATGQVITPTAPDTIAIGTDGMIRVDGGGVLTQGELTFEADGDADIDITHAAGALTYYLCIVTPDGGLEISSAITFAA